MAGSLSKQCDIQIADWAEAIRRSALQEMLIDASQPDIISFALGLPAPELFPGPDIAQAVESVLAADPNALQYGPPCQLLKEHIVRIMAKRGVECHQQEVFITSGAQQGMSLLTRLLLNPGGTVITEDLTYTGFSQVLQPFAPRLLTVATDAETGMDVEAVERYLKKGERPAFIYTIAEGHNPLGVSLSPEKRAHLLKLARHYSVPLLEDDAYGFLQYGTKSKPPLRSMDDQWVLYLGSFSKILGPALRTGWLIVPPTLISRLSIIKEASDIDTATLAQRAIAVYLDRHDLTGHLDTLRREYSARRDCLLDSLARSFPKGVQWNKPESGVFVWVELPKQFDTSLLLRKAVQTAGVAFIPGNAFNAAGNGNGTNCMRLNFSNSSRQKIETGIRRLASVMESAP